MPKLSMDMIVQLEFFRFEDEVRTSWRYVHSPWVNEFLGIVKATIPHRVLSIAEGEILWRAQLGHDREKDRQIPVPLPYPPERMKPLKDSAREGRANPKGIPCLYLSTDKDAAMSETRPWKGAMVSVAEFRTSRPLRIVNCALRDDEPVNFVIPPHGELEHDEAIWKFIDKAFAKPVTRADDAADYAPTQILAEIFRREGYDGIAYKSLFGMAHTITLFELDAAQFISCHLCTTKAVEHRFEEYDDHPE